MRFPTNPSQLPTTTGVLWMSAATATTAVMVAGAVRAARTTSSSGMTCAGLKKCMPATRWGRCVALAISSTFRADVLVQSSACGAHSRSSSENTRRFTPMSSTTASMTRSLLDRSAMRCVQCRRRSVASDPALDIFPRAIRLSSFLVTKASHFLRAASDVSNTTTSIFACKQQYAIPVPMVPAPTMPTRAGRGPWTRVSPSGIFRAAFSAKKKYCWAADWGEAINSPPKRRSTAVPAANVPALTEAHTASRHFRGASKPRADFFSFASACSLTNARWAASMMSGTGRLDSRRSATGRPFTFCASASAASKTVSVTVSTIPMDLASLARTGQPVKMRLSDEIRPIKRGRRCVPPAAGRMPRFTSGNEHLNCELQMR
mmetsp:Transcript_27993/g.70260  ORF Transcript_27993/g.70260 Transcript_27993/m.70260 type:complete len:375 (-) Transcript_27993:29-1153(-)